MAKVIVTETYLENIGDAIRSKLGGSDTYKPSEMAGAISQIHGDPVLEALSVSANGTYNPSSGKDGFSQAIVDVPNTYAAGDEGKVVSNGALVAQTSDTVTANDTYDTTLINQLTVNVSGGGGNIPIIPLSDWNNMTTAQKQACGLIIIQTASTGFERGRYVNGADYVLPAAVHIYTKSTGGSDAAMYVQNGTYEDGVFTAVGDPVSVLYTSVRYTRYDCNGIATLGYPNSWNVIATDTVTDGTNIFSSGATVKSWAYNVNTDFYLWKI